MQNVYADGCFSHQFKTAGVGWVIREDYQDHPSQEVLASKLPLVGIKSAVEIEFMAQYVCVQRASGILEIQKPIVLHTDNHETFRLLTNRRHPPDLLTGRDIYDLLDLYVGWIIQMAYRKTCPFMNKCDLLSREAMHELRDVVRPKSLEEKKKFNQKQNRIKRLVVPTETQGDE